MIQILRAARERLRASIVFLELTAPNDDLLLHALETPAPAICAADDGGIDDKALPTPGRSQRALKRRRVKV